MSRLTQKEKGTSQEKLLLIVRIEIQNYTAAGIEMEKGVNFEECIKKKASKTETLCLSLYLTRFLCVCVVSFLPPTKWGGERETGQETVASGIDLRLKEK